MGKAELALEHSIRKHCTSPLEINWMRAGDPGWEWKGAYPDGWHTMFTCFRFAIPELCAFKGRAIYLDVDQILMADITELWNTPLNGHTCLNPRRWDVILYDCAAFAKLPDWPSLATMQTSGWKINSYSRLIPNVGAMSLHWDCKDGKGLCADTKLLHYTKMATQPWKPWPERYKYPAHPCPEAAEIFWNEYHEAGGEPVTA